jgi:hypothetical protein
MRRHAISRVFLNCDKEKILNIVISWRHLSPFTCRKRDAHQLHVQSANQEERHGWVIKQLMFVVTRDLHRSPLPVPGPAFGEQWRGEYGGGASAIELSTLCSMRKDGRGARPIYLSI